MAAGVWWHGGPGPSAHRPTAGGVAGGFRGVGPETADDILLYAFARPVFVIDAYTRRLLAALGMAQGDEPYESLRLAFERALGEDVPMYNEYHALIVRHAKERCIYQPDCRRCRVEQRICA